MNRLLAALLALGLPTFAIAAEAPPAHPPISSKADLDRYLRDTPPGTSPLDALSPGGRKRFLENLSFYPHGVGIDYSEPSEELTHPQIAGLFDLFGQHELAEGLGLSPPRKKLRDQEREVDAKARSCALQNCPETRIEQNFDILVTAKPDRALPDAERFARITRSYDRLFAEFQHPDRLSQTSAPDLRLLKRAAEYALFGAQDPLHLAQLRMDLEEMQRRGMIDDEDYADLYGALVANRQFAAAATLQRGHPKMGAAPLPTFVPNTEALPAGQPTALSIDARTHTMHREAVGLDGPLHIVVIAGCHFSEDAARAIEGDAQLRPLFARHSTWLSNASSDLAEVPTWNRQFADLPMLVAWSAREWPMLDSWAMPTYYVFRNGQLAKKFSGWWGVAALKQSLREAGALH